MGHPGESRLLDKAEVSATNMKSAIEVLNVFENIRRAQRAGVYAPHKPLLLLLAFARVQRGEPRLVEFADIDASLRSLLTEFGPSSAAKSRHYPFWHLATDGHGALWDLSGPREVLKRPAGATPSLGELREHHIKAGFPADVDEALRHIPGLLQAVASRLLDTYFPATLHSDIVATLGLDLDGANEMRDDVPVAADYSAADVGATPAFGSGCCAPTSTGAAFAASICASVTRRPAWRPRTSNGITLVGLTLSPMDCRCARCTTSFST
jgi:hypothetical protein